MCACVRACACVCITCNHTHINAYIQFSDAFPRLDRLDRGAGKVAVLKEDGLAFSKTLATWVKERAMKWMVNNGVSCPVS